MCVCIISYIYMVTIGRSWNRYFFSVLPIVIAKCVYARTGTGTDSDNHIQKETFKLMRWALIHTHTRTHFYGSSISPGPPWHSVFPFLFFLLFILLFFVCMSMPIRETLRISKMNCFASCSFVFGICVLCTLYVRFLFHLPPFIQHTHTHTYIYTLILYPKAIS